jgi:CheY-like chemotaxis protein
MGARKVLFVDDEPQKMADHIAALSEAGYLVTSRNSTDEALRDLLDDNPALFHLVVLDMMLPPPDGKDFVPSRYFGEVINFETWEGLHSGGNLLGILRRRSGESRPPVLILSNVQDGEVLIEAWDQFVSWCAFRKQQVPSAAGESEVRQVLKLQFGTWIHSKKRTPPWELPGLAETIIGK